jgi:hypothetical protein
MKTALTIATIAAAAGTANAQLDGQNIPTDAANDGLSLLATQNSPTAFGNATGGGQDSAGGSELNQLWASLDGTTLNLSITGNLEGNFNKFWIFFDAVAGGENALAADNVDGGFNEIQSLAGLTFDNGVEMDHAIRFEIGGGFYSARFADLIDNSAGDIATGGGPGDLPLTDAGGPFGTTFGWDNSNTAGVDGMSAAGASSATTGWEFAIDLAGAFGSASSQVGITAFVSNGGGDFVSNQVLPGIDSPDNVGAPDGATLPVAVIPAPGSAALVALAGLTATRRRR